jgi:hypothetical protein
MRVKARSLVEFIEFWEYLKKQVRDYMAKSGKSGST